MVEMVKQFLNDETAAVTVDWVVLTAAIVFLGVAIAIPVGTQTNTLAQKIGTNVGAMPAPSTEIEFD